MDIARITPFRVKTKLDRIDRIPEGIKMIHAPAKWKKGYKGKGIVTAVIDTGCHTSHPDLSGRIIGVRNFTKDGDNRDVSDYMGHGTHVAGTVAANFNKIGVVGVAPLSRLLILKAFDNNGNGRLDDMVNAIEYAIHWRGPRNEKVRIISLSSGTTVKDARLYLSIRRAVANNIMVICAAGNEGDGYVRTDEKVYPGYYSEVVQVGAVDCNANMAGFTNTNDQIDLVAPGVDIVSTYLDDKYAALSGTSMASPHVAGAAALLIEQMENEFGRALSEPEIYAQLVKSTMSLRYSKRVEGNGLIMLDVEQEDYYPH
ncbi:S8 family peptidase [Gracilibacillus salinarum]|uniref:S8 family peptidase n=1 Tax=Gracilibacillus salinarum TaxID=2932255 RepID=A0ABY4GQI0_9BACI|nr:S8 family peptidase [Gracilibacillus salinarum]UOQ86446.1 S8 family peptidase [Gracilibacillus salinarum]